MRVKSLSSPFLLLALLSCTSAEQTNPEDELLAANKMTCIVDGETLTGTGEQVGVASFGMTEDTMSLGLSLNIDKNGQQLMITTGLTKLPIRRGSYYFPALDLDSYGGGGYTVKNKDGETLKDFSQANYLMFYAQAAKDPATKLQIRLTSIEQLPAAQPAFGRVKMKGNFKFKAAYVPYVNGNLPEACTTEAIARSIKRGPQFPKFNASICGAEETTISGSFEVTQDLMKAK